MITQLVGAKYIILDELKDKSIGQKSIAITYAYCIRNWQDGEDTDFAAINRAIASRWSVSGMERVKKLAWKLVQRGGLEKALREESISR